MAEFDPGHGRPASGDALLQELESLARLLRRSPTQTATAPGRAAADERSAAPGLIDIDQVFDDNAADCAAGEQPAARCVPGIQPTLHNQSGDTALAAPLEAAATGGFSAPFAAAQWCPPHRREQLLQALVDAMMPRLEADLRARLSRLDDTALARLLATGTDITANVG